MISTIKDMFRLLSPAQRRRFYKLQLLVVVMAITEILGITMIGPFIAMITDPLIFEKNTMLSQVFLMSGFNSHSEFVFYSGIALLCLLCFGAMLSVFTIWKLSVFGAAVGTEIGDRLFKYYLCQNWLFHTKNNSSHLTKQVSTESIRLTDFVLIPLMQMNSRLVLSVLLMLVLFALNPLAALIGVLVFISSFMLIYRVVKFQLMDNGKKISKNMACRFHLLSVGFGGIRDVILLNKRQELIGRFEESGREYSTSRGRNQAFSTVPRYFVEFLTFGSVISLMLLFGTESDFNLADMLPFLAVYALAALKLLPAFQLIYNNAAVIRGNLAAFDSIKNDLEKSMASSHTCYPITSVVSNQESFNAKTNIKKIELLDIGFSYPSTEKSILNDLDMRFPVNKTIGLVGPSGSGKSTVIDVLLGLITPDSGGVYVNGKPLSDFGLESWQKSIGYVSQSIFLYDATIAENIAFSLSKDSIDFDKVNVAIRRSHLLELVESLPDGINTMVGERGVLLSGGQRQRIGIARALYHDADILVLDEATSALDGITEKLIMEAIHDFSGCKTIIMIAHRLATVRSCDIIYYMDKGCVIDQGTYQELIDKNEDFRKMAASY